MSVATTIRHEPLLLRHPANPILTAKDWPYSINSVFNAGATLLADGSTLLLCRVEDRRGLSHLCAARSRNGVDNWQIDKEPTLMPSPKEYPEEIWGIEDPRITFVPELQQYVVTYTSYSRGGPGVSLALTKDFRSFERYGVIMPPDDKDSALAASENRWMLGAYSSADDAAGVAHVDFLLSRPALLGQAQAYVGGAPRRLVGREQDWLVAAAHRDFQRLARVLPRSAAHAFGLSVSTWAWLCSSLRIRQSVYCEGIRGSLGPRPTTSVTATSMMLCSLADTRWTPMATASIFTTELLTARLPWLGPAFALYSIGWMPMEVASGDERRTYETTALDFALGVWVPSPDKSVACSPSRSGPTGSASSVGKNSSIPGLRCIQYGRVPPPTVVHD